MKNLSCRLLLGAGRVGFHRPCSGRVDLLLPTGIPAKAASAANPPPEALPDAPVQIHTDCTNAMRARFEPDPLAFRAEWI